MFKFPSLVNSSFEREIWEGNFGRLFNSFPCHVAIVNKHTGLDDPSFSKCGHAGRHSSKEIMRIGMSRTPFSCLWISAAAALGELTGFSFQKPGSKF